jgi:hypothetical protein
MAAGKEKEKGGSWSCLGSWAFFSEHLSLKFLISNFNFKFKFYIN